MKSQFVIERQGRKFVLYEGLLDEAHNRGLTGIETWLIQTPSTENKYVAIVKAVAYFGEERHFSGTGDASPENVNRAIAKHLIRMAETRAKARALRDGINVGLVALEELGGDEETDGSSEAVAHQADPTRSEVLETITNLVSRYFGGDITQFQTEYTAGKDYRRVRTDALRRVIEKVIQDQEGGDTDVDIDNIPGVNKGIKDSKEGRLNT